MQYVDWLSTVVNLDSDGIIMTDYLNLPDEAILWQDMLSDTNFFLEKKKAEDINKGGIEYLTTLLSTHENDGASIAARFLRGEDDNAPPMARLMPELPVIPLIGDEGKKRAWRLGDLLLVRAGLAYALSSGDIRENWEKQFRLGALLEGAGVYGSPGNDLCPISDKIKGSLCLAGDCLQGNLQDGAAAGNVDIVKCSAVKIKSYFLETNKLPNIRGASRLLDDLNRRRLPDLVAKRFTPESVIYAGGGHVLALVPEGCGQGLSAEMERICSRVTITAKFVSASVTVSAMDLAPGGLKFKRVSANIEESLKRRQMLNIPWEQVEEPDGNINEGLPEGSGYLKPGGERVNNAGLCNHCNMRPARWQIDYGSGKKELLCSSCNHRFVAGGLAGRKGYRGDYQTFCLKNGLPMKDIPQTGTLDELAACAGGDNKHIAMVYADGNNMGSIVLQLESLLDLRCFSERTKAIAEEATYRALAEVQGDGAVEIVALGGDDILLFVPAPRAFALASRMGILFDEAFINHSTGERPITLSVGVAIGRYSQPVRYLFDTAQELLKSAKKKAKLLSDNNKAQGTIDVEVMESITAFSSNVEEYRSATFNQLKGFTLRPYTWGEARAVADGLRFVKTVPSGRSFCFALLNALREMIPAESNLYYLYKMAKLSSENRKSVEKALADLARVAGCRRDGAYIVSSAYKIVPWLDFLELWDYDRGWLGEGGNNDAPLAQSKNKS